MMTISIEDRPFCVHVSMHEYEYEYEYEHKCEYEYECEYISTLPCVHIHINFTILVIFFQVVDFLIVHKYSKLK